MKKQFVTITAGNHPDWTAEDWKCLWGSVLSLIRDKEHSRIWMEQNLGKDILARDTVHFTDWNFWMGVDPAVDTDKTSNVTFKIDAKHAHAYGIVDESDCPICQKNIRVHRKLRSYGISEENFIVRDGKVFMNNPVLDNLLGEK